MGTDETIGSSLEAWLTRKTEPDRCRFCNGKKDSLRDEPPKDKFCSHKCLLNFEYIMKARLAIWERDMKQRRSD